MTTPDVHGYIWCNINLRLALFYNPSLILSRTNSQLQSKSFIITMALNLLFHPFILAKASSIRLVVSLLLNKMELLNESIVTFSICPQLYSFKPTYPHVSREMLSLELPIWSVELLPTPLLFGNLHMKSYTTRNLNTITCEFSVVCALLPLIHRIHQNLTLVQYNVSSLIILMVRKDTVYMILIITKPSYLVMSFFMKILSLLPKPPLSNLYRSYLFFLTSLMMFLPPVTYCWCSNCPFYHLDCLFSLFNHSAIHLVDLATCILAWFSSCTSFAVSYHSIIWISVDVFIK